MFAATNAEAVPKYKLFGLDFRDFCFMERDSWRKSGIEVVVVVVCVIKGAVGVGGRDRGGGEVGTGRVGRGGRGRTESVSLPLPLQILATCSSGERVWAFRGADKDRLLLLCLFSDLLRTSLRVVSLKTNSGGTFSPIILCNLAILILFSLSVKELRVAVSCMSGTDATGVGGRSRSTLGLDGKCDVFKGERGPRTESTLNFLRSKGVMRGGAGMGGGTSLGRGGEEKTMLLVDWRRRWSTGTADILKSRGWARGCLAPFDFLDLSAEKTFRTSGLLRGWWSSDEVDSSELAEDENWETYTSFLPTTCGVVPRRASIFLAVRKRRVRCAGSMALLLVGATVDMKKRKAEAQRRLWETK